MLSSTTRTLWSPLSKSLGNYKDPREYIAKYGRDAVRYYVLREIPFGNDGNFSEEALVSRINSDLANIWGNLVNRTVGMANKYFDGKITNKGVIQEIDMPLLKELDELKINTDKLIDELQISKVLELIFDVLRLCNKYIDETTPWALAKDENQLERLETVLYNILEAIRITNILLRPFMPTSTEKVIATIHSDKNEFSDSHFLNDLTYIVDKTPSPLFERIQ